MAGAVMDCADIWKFGVVRLAVVNTARVDGAVGTAEMFGADCENCGWVSCGCSSGGLTTVWSFCTKPLSAAKSGGS